MRTTDSKMRWRNIAKNYDIDSIHGREITQTGQTQKVRVHVSDRDRPHMTELNTDDYDMEEVCRRG